MNVVNAAGGVYCPIGVKVPVRLASQLFGVIKHASIVIVVASMI
jgi:hypothetical protein